LNIIPPIFKAYFTLEMRGKSIFTIKRVDMVKIRVFQKCPNIGANPILKRGQKRGQKQSFITIDWKNYVRIMEKGQKIGYKKRLKS